MADTPQNGNGVRIPRWLWQLWKNAIQWAVLVGVPAGFVGGFQLYSEIKMNRTDILEINVRMERIGKRLDEATNSVLRATSVLDRVVVLEEDMKGMTKEFDEARDARKFIFNTISSQGDRIDLVHDFAGTDALLRLEDDVHVLELFHGIQRASDMLEGYERSPHHGPQGPG